MTKNKRSWRLVAKKPVFESKWLSVYANDYKLPDGSLGKDYYHLSRPDYVLILAVNQKKEIVVQHNYRRGVDDFIYELPGGWVEKDEKPAKTAERELNRLCRQSDHSWSGISAAGILFDAGLCCTSKNQRET